MTVLPLRLYVRDWVTGTWMLLELQSNAEDMGYTIKLTVI